jgi:AcrR family transcriptional regulator
MSRTAKALFTLRKTPVQARSQQTVEVILDAAAQVLEGDPGASTNHIAARAGFSIGTLYQYFPNRDAILAAIALREQTRILAGIEAALGELDPQAPEAALRKALRHFLHAFGSRQRLRRRVILTLLPQMPDVLRGQMADAVIGACMDMLRERGGGRFRPLDKTARFVLTRAVMGVVRAAVVEGSVDLRDPALEDELVRLMVGYVSL